MKTISPPFCLPLVALLSVASVAFAEESKPVSIELRNAKGEKVGEAKLTSAKDGVRVDLKAAKLEPGKHGIHFHEKGSCVGPDFKSAGGHLNPEHREHGLDNAQGPHAGDIPNIEVSRSGTVRTHFVARHVSLGAGPDSLERPEGAALVIHARADDQHSNPAGESGDRVVCGVIPALSAHGSRE
jgi:superoxide dismutase, Cu-Zn family